MDEIVIVSGVRTPVGKFQGSLSDISATRLGAVAVREAVKRTQLEPGKIDECIMGNVVSAGLGQNPARQAAIFGGLPPEVSAVTVNMVCGSGLRAVALGAQSIQTGNSDIVVAGGMESMTNAPYLLPQARSGFRMGNAVAVDSDGSIREDTTIEALRSLKPAFKKDGTVTAGNAPGVNDASAAVVIMSAAKARELGLPPMARIVAHATRGRDPKWVMLAPVNGARKAMERAGWSIDSIDLFEFNEAFA